MRLLFNSFDLTITRNVKIVNACFKTYDLTLKSLRQQILSIIVLVFVIY